MSKFGVVEIHSRHGSLRRSFVNVDVVQKTTGDDENDVNGDDDNSDDDRIAKKGKSEKGGAVDSGSATPNNRGAVT